MGLSGWIFPCRDSALPETFGLDEELRSFMPCITQTAEVFLRRYKSHATHEHKKPRICVVVTMLLLDHVCAAACCHFHSGLFLKDLPDP